MIVWCIGLAFLYTSSLCGIIDCGALGRMDSSEPSVSTLLCRSAPPLVMVVDALIDHPFNERFTDLPNLSRSSHGHHPGDEHPGQSQLVLATALTTFGLMLLHSVGYATPGPLASIARRLDDPPPRLLPL